MDSNFYFWLHTFQYHGSCIGFGSKFPSFYPPDATHMRISSCLWFKMIFCPRKETDIFSKGRSVKHKSQTHFFLPTFGPINFPSYMKLPCYGRWFEIFLKFSPLLSLKTWSNLTNILEMGWLKPPTCMLVTNKSRHCGSLTIRMPAGAVGHGGREGGPRGLGESCSTWISGWWFLSKKSPTGPTVHGPLNLSIS